MGDGSALHLRANLSDRTVSSVPPAATHTIWGNTDTGMGMPWSIQCWIGEH
jgi:maltooligosyltrehalose trehalohydrolase